MQTQASELLEKSFDATAARAIVAAIDIEIDARKDTLATKLDVAGLRTEIAESKAEVIRWMFIFWVGTVFSMGGVTFGAMYFLLSRLKP